MHPATHSGHSCCHIVKYSKLKGGKDQINQQNHGKSGYFFLFWH